MTDTVYMLHVCSMTSLTWSETNMEALVAAYTNRHNPVSSYYQKEALVFLDVIIHVPLLHISC